MANKQQ